MKKKPIHYSMVIEWSEEDQAYLVTLPEWAPPVIMPATHGNTYEKAAKHGREVLEMLIKEANKHAEPLPQPQIYVSH